MSFTPIEILQEFEEAAWLGRRSPRVRMEEEDAQRWWRAEGFTRLRPKLAIAVDPRYRELPQGIPSPESSTHGSYQIQRTLVACFRAPAVIRLTCELCGGAMEGREGTRRAFHVNYAGNERARMCPRRTATVRYDPER